METAERTRADVLDRYGISTKAAEIETALRGELELSVTRLTPAELLCVHPNGDGAARGQILALLLSRCAMDAAVLAAQETDPNFAPETDALREERMTRAAKLRQRLAKERERIEHTLQEK